MEEKLIEAVRRRTILYDTSHCNYMKNKLKSEVWEEVSKEADLESGAVAKSVWEKLRHSLRDALRRQKNHKRSGAPATVIKPWKFQKEMSFLQPFMANRMREGNLQDDSESDDAHTPNLVSENFDPDERQQRKERLENDIENDEDSPSSNNIQNKIADTSSQAIPKPSFPPEKRKLHSVDHSKMRKSTIAALLKENMEVRQQMSERRSEERKQLLNEMKPPSDPLYNFFISMYETTKRMPPAAQFSVRNEIFQAVTNMEAKLLNISGPVHSGQKKCSQSMAEYSCNEIHGNSQQIWNPAYPLAYNAAMGNTENYPVHGFANKFSHDDSN